MDVFDVLTMLGGLALFLYGMTMLGESLAKMSGGRLEKTLEKLTSNPVKAVLLGAGVTAVIQSSSATTVMVVGFVNSGIMKLSQAVGIIMGANIGTTVTSWILSLTGIEGGSLVTQLLKPTSFAPVLAVIGVILMMFSKDRKKKNVASILLGFTILMFGMDTMSSAVEPLADIPEFTGILLMFSHPLLGVLAGLAFIIPAGMEHSAFQKAHPYIEDFYTAEEKSAAGRRLACGVVGGVGVIFVGVMGLLLAEDGPYENVAASALIMLAAVGAWLIVHFALMYGRTNVAEYNKSVADDLELEEIANLTVEEEYKAALLQKKRHSQKVGAVCAVIMLVATTVGLLLLFAPLFGGQNIDDIDWNSGGSTYFWLAWPIGALLCGVAAILMNAFRKE